VDEKMVADRMNKAIGSLKTELGKIRTGRATTALLDTIMVDAYGSRMPLKSLATVSAPEARLLTIQPWDVSQTDAIEKAIRSSDIGLTPTNDGKLIRIQIPPHSEERRRELVKLVKKVGEEARVSIRLIRRDANDGLKNETIPEDMKRKLQEKIQKLTDEQIKQIDLLLDGKEKELLNV
jgi:ribosome recycling factor